MTETEIERMVVRLRGDNTHYVSMFEQASAVAKSFSDKLVAVSTAVVSAMSNMGSKVSGIIKSMGDTIRNVGLPLGGGVLSKLGGGIETTLEKSTGQWASYGKNIGSISKEFKIASTEASVFSFISNMTGRSVEDLMQTVKVGSKEFDNWAKEAKSLGLVLRTGTIVDADAFRFSVSRLKEATQGFWSTLGSVAAPELKKWNELITAAIKIATKWVEEHKPLLAKIYDIASALVIAGTVITSFGTALVTAGTFLTPFTAALMAIAGALTVVEMRTGEGRRLWDTYKDSLKNVWDATVAYLKPIVAFVQKTFDGVKNAILGGKPELAVQILWNSIQIAWINGLKELDRITGGAFKAIFQNLAAGNWEAAGAAAMNELKLAFDKGLIELESIWATLRVQLNTSMVDVTNFADHFYTEISIAVNKIILRLQEVWAFVGILVKNIAIIFGVIGVVLAAPWIGLVAVVAWVGKKIIDVFVFIAPAIAKILGVVFLPITTLIDEVVTGLGVIGGAVFDESVLVAKKETAILLGLADQALGISDTMKADAKAMEGIEKTGHMEEAARKRLRTAEMEKANQEILANQAARRATLEEEIATIQIDQLRLAEKGEVAAANALADKEVFLKAELAQAEAAAKAAKFEVDKIPDLEKVDKDIDKKLKPKTIKIDFKVEGLEEVRAGTEKFFEMQRRTQAFLDGNKAIAAANKAEKEVEGKVEAPKGAGDYVDPMDAAVEKAVKAAEDATMEEGEMALHGTRRNKFGRVVPGSIAPSKSDTNRTPRPVMQADEFSGNANQDTVAAKLLEKIAKATETMAKRDEISFQPAGFA